MHFLMLPVSVSPNLLNLLDWIEGRSYTSQRPS